MLLNRIITALFIVCTALLLTILYFGIKFHGSWHAAFVFGLIWVFIVITRELLSLENEEKKR